MEETLRIVDEFQLSNTSCNLAEFREENRYCDVTILVDGQEINAHKCILAAGSKYFDQKLAESPSSKERTLLKLSFDAPFRIILIIIVYLYTGAIEYCNDDVIPIIESLNALRIECKTIVEKLINSANCFQILNTQKKLKSLNLRQVALEYIATHLDDLYKCPAFKEITKQDASINKFFLKMIMYILSLYKERDIEEVTLFLAITKWIENDIDNRLNCLDEFLNFIPSRNFNCVQFKTHILPNKTLRSSGAACKWLVDGLAHLMNNRAVKICTSFNMYVFSRGPDTTMYSVGSDEDGLSLRERSIRPELDSFIMTKYKRFIYAIGGKRHNQTVNIGLRYDEDLETWAEFLCPLGKSSCGVWTSKFDKMFVLGGMIGNASQKSCSCYDYSTGEWMPMPNMLKERWLPGVCSYSSSIYVFGGLSFGNYRPIVERYDHREGTWSQAGILNFQTGTVAARLKHTIYCLQLGTKDIKAYDPRNLTFDNIGTLHTRGEWMCTQNDELYILHKGGILSGDPEDSVSALHKNFGARSILVS